MHSMRVARRAHVAFPGVGHQKVADIAVQQRHPVNLLAGVDAFSLSVYIRDVREAIFGHRHPMHTVFDAVEMQHVEWRDTLLNTRSTEVEELIHIIARRRGNPWLVLPSDCRSGSREATNLSLRTTLEKFVRQSISSPGLADRDFLFLDTNRLRRELDIILEVEKGDIGLQSHFLERLKQQSLEWGFAEDFPETPAAGMLIPCTVMVNAGVRERPLWLIEDAQKVMTQDCSSRGGKIMHSLWGEMLAQRRLDYIGLSSLDDFQACSRAVDRSHPIYIFPKPEEAEALKELGKKPSSTLLEQVKEFLSRIATARVVREFVWVPVFVLCNALLFWQIWELKQIPSVECEKTDGLSSDQMA